MSTEKITVYVPGPGETLIRLGDDTLLVYRDGKPIKVVHPSGRVEPWRSAAAAQKIAMRIVTLFFLGLWSSALVYFLLVERKCYDVTIGSAPLLASYDRAQR